MHWFVQAVQKASNLALDPGSCEDFYSDHQMEQKDAEIFAKEAQPNMLSQMVLTLNDVSHFWGEYVLSSRFLV